MAKLTINTDAPREVFEKTYTGEVIYPQNSNKLCSLVVSSIENSAGLLKFQVVVQFPKDIVSEDKNVELLAIAWAVDNLPQRLSEAGYWNYFEASRFDVSNLPDTEAQGRWDSTEIEISMLERGSAVLDEALEHLAKTREAFDSALDALSEFVAENTPYGFKASLPQARKHFDVLEEVARCSAQLGVCSASDVRHALSSYEELGRRKIENNPNYQAALSRVKNVIWGLSFPTVWGRKPNI